MLYFYCVFALTYMATTSAYNYLPHFGRALRKLSFPVKYDIPKLKPEDFPVPPFPNTWYPICFEKDIKEGKTYPFQIAGEDIILFRNDNNSIRGVDRYCKHNGVDLTYGKINNKCIVCPFHNKQMFGNLPIEVTNGMVFLWKGPVNDKKQPPFTMKSLMELVGYEDLKPIPFFKGVHTMGGHPVDFAEQVFDFKHAIPVHGQNVVDSHWKVLDNDHTYTAEFEFWSNRKSRSIGVTPTMAIIEFFNDAPIIVFFIINDVGKMDMVFVPTKKSGTTIKQTLKSIFSAFYIYGDTQDEAAYITTKDHHKRKLDPSEHKMTTFREWYKQTFFNDVIPN